MLIPVRILLRHGPMLDLSLQEKSRLHTPASKPLLPLPGSVGSGEYRFRGMRPGMRASGRAAHVSNPVTPGNTMHLTQTYSQCMQFNALYWYMIYPYCVVTPNIYI